MTEPRYRLTDLELDEWSFVGEGDNPGAHILFTKERSASEAPQKESEEPMERINKRADVVKAIERRAEDLSKQEGIPYADAYVRMTATEGYRKLTERYYELPEERVSPDVTPEAEAFMAKSAPPSSASSAGAEGEFWAEVEKVMENDYVDRPEAVARVLERRPDLVQKMHKERVY